MARQARSLANVFRDVVCGELHGGAVAAAQGGEAGVEEHLAAVGEIHAASLAGIGSGVARVDAGLGGDEV